MYKRQESGQIIVDSQELTEDNVWDIRDKIGMVFQNPDNQFVGATVEDDVAFGLENKGVPYEEMALRVQESLEFVGMSEFKDREPARLSGGQKQRVAIAGIVAVSYTHLRVMKTRFLKLIKFLKPKPRRLISLISLLVPSNFAFE